MFGNPFASRAKKRYEKRTLRDLKRQYNKLSTRSKAIFDKFFVAPEDVPGTNKVRTEFVSYAGERVAGTGEPLKKGEFRVGRQDDIEAYNKAFEALSKQIKKGKIMAQQKKKMGRRPAEQATNKLKIQAEAPSKTPTTATGRYTPIGGRNVLKIKGGVN